MFRIYTRILITLLLLVFPFQRAFSQQKITVALGNTLPPWVMVEDNTGIIPDLLRATLGVHGYQIHFVYVPYARRIPLYTENLVDVVSDINEKVIETHQMSGYFSDIAYSYENFAFSLTKQNLQLSSIAQLKHFSVLSWQGAKELLSPEYQAMARENPQYAETYDQLAQVQLLYRERYEVIQMDGKIFDYYRALININDEIDVSKPVQRFALFGKNPSGFLFRDEALRDLFNENLRKLKSTEEYTRIINRYTSKSH